MPKHKGRLILKRFLIEAKYHTEETQRKYDITAYDIRLSILQDLPFLTLSIKEIKHGNKEHDTILHSKRDKYKKSDKQKQKEEK